MKPDAILVNVARGAIVDEDALYAHLRDHPKFSAGIDAWWEEPFGGGAFRTRHPFFDLPNVLGPRYGGHTARPPGLRPPGGARRRRVRRAARPARRGSRAGRRDGARHHR